MTRQSDIAKIHIAKKDLGMEDDAYRAMLMDVAKVDSASKLDFQGRHRVLHRLGQLGWKPKRKPMKTGPKSTKSMGDKIRALWIELANDGIVRDKSEAALMAYVKRMTNGKYQAPQFCDAYQAGRIIEALKKWRKRVENTPSPQPSPIKGEGVVNEVKP
ncbi:MAG: gp16 family protein [Thiomicrospira sp.]